MDHGGPDLAPALPQGVKMDVIHGGRDGKTRRPNRARVAAFSLVSMLAAALVAGHCIPPRRGVPRRDAAAPEEKKKAEADKSPTPAQRRDSAVLKLEHCDGLYEAGVRALRKGATSARRAAFVKARRCFETVCDRGVAEACRELGFMYAGNRGGVKDGAKGAAVRERAEMLFARRCKRGDGYACAISSVILASHASGLAWTLGAGEVAKLLRKSLRLGRRACALRSALGCRNLGYALLDKRVGRPQPARALAAYRKGCRLGPRRLPGPMQKTRTFGCKEAKALCAKHPLLRGGARGLR